MGKRAKPSLRARIGNSGLDSDVFLEIDGEKYTLPVRGLRVTTTADDFTTLEMTTYISGVEILLVFEWDDESRKYIGKVIRDK